MHQLVAAIGGASRRTSHWTDLGEIQRRGVVAALADHGLILLQRAGDQATRRAVSPL